MLVTTVDRINDEKDNFLLKVPFMQVIVDHAEIEAHRQATTKIPCKRIICSTSNLMPKNIDDILGLVHCIDPFAIDQLGFQQQQEFRDIRTLVQLRESHKFLSPYVIKMTHTDLEKLFGEVSHIELNVPMTMAQSLMYKEIYKTHASLISKLVTLENFTKDQLEQMKVLHDHLLRCCNSVFMVDKEEVLLDRCNVLSKKELKGSLKQQFVSGKILMLMQIIEDLSSSSKKLILCTNYPDLIPILRRFLKEVGIACFMHQPTDSIDSVYRFNLYSGKAVFLFQLGQTWSREDCSLFDLDFI